MPIRFLPRSTGRCNGCSRPLRPSGGYQYICAECRKDRKWKRRAKAATRKAVERVIAKEGQNVSVNKPG